MPEEDKKKIVTNEQSTSPPKTKPIDIPKKTQQNLKCSFSLYNGNNSSNFCVCKTGIWCDFCLGDYDDFV